VAAQVLAAADSGAVTLTTAQRERLSAQAAATRERIDSLIAIIAPAASAADTSAAERQVAELRRLTGSARTLLSRSTADAQAVLTTEQWAHLPASIRERSPYLPLVPAKPIIIETGEP
jgi:Spy/CpxP family protein refolding chaperone